MVSCGSFLDWAEIARHILDSDRIARPRPNSRELLYGLERRSLSSIGVSLQLSSATRLEFYLYAPFHLLGTQMFGTTPASLKLLLPLRPWISLQYGR